MWKWNKAMSKTGARVLMPSRKQMESGQATWIHCCWRGIGREGMSIDELRRGDGHEGWATAFDRCSKGVPLEISTILVKSVILNLLYQILHDANFTNPGFF
jgi:hypothetical protein